jgi:hypothetical protein
MIRATTVVFNSVVLYCMHYRFHEVHGGEDTFPPRIAERRIPLLQNCLRLVSVGASQ